ncbi:voltage-gated protein/chloride channel-like protein [Patellaria atrata CBS 101060]|uniref:Voltage-gated protein/chloride channel-like protein n=1 Tax=Patellaria atrata CBS 101060 TaxID=1346257 RepID=A0A9P4S7V9_9PEZI|nr:voltage-gated protein/chloride channel-like protein [Patellaria atrata CBS 101060]
MPHSSLHSYRSVDSRDADDEEEDDDPTPVELSNSGILWASDASPMTRPYDSRRSIERRRSSEIDGRVPVDEQSSLLRNADSAPRYSATSGIHSPPALRRNNSGSRSLRRSPARSRQTSIGSRRDSFSSRLVNALHNHHRRASVASENGNLYESRLSVFQDDRVWYDQFTSTDWVHDSIADAYRVKQLRSRKDIRGRLLAWFDRAEGWILVAIIGCCTAFIAYFVNITEAVLFDFKSGYCSTSWYMSKKNCCSGASTCENWTHWSESFVTDALDTTGVQYVAFVCSVIILACLSCILTLSTKTVIPSALSLSTLDENLGAPNLRVEQDEEAKRRGVSPANIIRETEDRPPMVYYSAAGSGVAEVRVINSGFVLHGYLGVRTLVIKTIGLILSISSGLSLGKEGPYVHIATCIGNIMCRLFSKYNHNDGKRREVLSASAASGVAVAFGAPIGGVLFSLEEVSYYFPPKTLFRTFFCCIVAALSLKFLNPYGTHKIVLFEVRYLTDWEAVEMLIFIMLGVIGGALGAFFIKASRFWARTFRRVPLIKEYPLIEVFLVAALTGLVSFWNRYTRLPVTELLFELASPCDTFTSSGMGLCPTNEHIPKIIGYLAIAFVIKALLTTITFGIKVPAGIYVPSMVVGGLFGRMVGHIVQYLALNHPDGGLFGMCGPDDNPEACVVPGVYALVAAGATMCGVTRLSVTLAVILFELTGSLDHVLPFSIAVLVSKWTADAIEPLSIYDLLTDMNSYPFLDNKVRPIFTTELGDLTHRLRPERIIDISNSPLVPAKELRQKLDILHIAGEIDGGLPIVHSKVLVGLIPAPDLEFALDKLDNEDNSLCLMSTQVHWNNPTEGEDEEDDPTDFTSYIDPAPVALDIHSPMDLVYECFVKLGLRYIAVLKNGRFAGLVSFYFHV